MEVRVSKLTLGKRIRLGIIFRRLLIGLFHSLDNFKPTRGLINSFLNRAEDIGLGNEKELEFIASRDFLICSLISASVFFISVVLGKGLYGIGAGVVVAYGLVRLVINNQKAKRYISYMQELDRYICDIKHGYYKTHSVSGAAEYAKHRSGSRINLESCNNKYLSLLNSLMRLIDENGDLHSIKGSVFVESLLDIRMEINDEIRLFKKKQNKFRGLSLTAMLPILAVPYVTGWAVDTLSSLLHFYYGRIGSVFRLVLIFLSLAAILLINLLSGIDDSNIFNDFLAGIWHRVVEHYGPLTGKRIKLMKKSRQRLGRLICVIFMSSISFITIISALNNTRQLLRNDCRDIDTKLKTADGRFIRTATSLIPEYIKRYEHSSKPLSPSEIKERLMGEVGLRGEAEADKLSVIIYERIETINNTRLMFSDSLIIIAAAIIGFFIPDLLELGRAIFKNRNKQEEVSRFYSLVHILRKVPGMTTVDFLIAIESFSDIYRQAFRQAISEYAISDMRALRHLEEFDSYIPFRQLISCFEAVDTEGIEDAFGEISDEIVTFRENRNMENSITVDAEIMLGEMLAVIPGGVIIFLYMLMPFMVGALRLFTVYQNELGGLI